MNHPSDIKRFTAAATAIVVLTVRPASATAEQHVVCPASASRLDSAEPVLGPLDAPWGELHEAESVRRKDGAYVIRYDLTGGEAPRSEKWLICHYRDDSHRAVKLPVATTTCRVTTRQDGAVDPATKRPYYRVLDITCR
jgi:hypothetical protein